MTNEEFLAKLPNVSYGNTEDDDVDASYTEEEWEVDGDDDELPSEGELATTAELLGFDPREIESDD